jgi:hypothetical protein
MRPRSRERRRRRRLESPLAAPPTPPRPPPAPTLVLRNQRARSRSPSHSRESTKPTIAGTERTRDKDSERQTTQSAASRVHSSGGYCEREEPHHHHPQPTPAGTHHPTKGPFPRASARPLDPLDPRKGKLHARPVQRRSIWGRDRTPRQAVGPRAPTTTHQKKRRPSQLPPPPSPRTCSRAPLTPAPLPPKIPYYLPNHRPTHGALPRASGARRRRRGRARRCVFFLLGWPPPAAHPPPPTAPGAGRCRPTATFLPPFFAKTPPHTTPPPPKQKKPTKNNKQSPTSNAAASSAPSSNSAAWAWAATWATWTLGPTPRRWEGLARPREAAAWAPTASQGAEAARRRARSRSARTRGLWEGLACRSRRTGRLGAAGWG